MRILAATAAVPAAIHHWLRPVQHSPDAKPQDADSDTNERPDDNFETINDRLLYITDYAEGELRIDIYKGRMNAKGTGLNKAIRRYFVIYQLGGVKALPGFFRPVGFDHLSRLARSRRVAGQSSCASYDLPCVLRTAYCVLRISSTHLSRLRSAMPDARSPKPPAMLGLSGPTR